MRGIFVPAVLTRGVLAVFIIHEHDRPAGLQFFENLRDRGKRHLRSLLLKQHPRANNIVGPPPSAVRGQALSALERGWKGAGAFPKSENADGQAARGISPAYLTPSTPHMSRIAAITKSPILHASVRTGRSH